MENNVYPDCVVGVSAGSMNGLSYVSRQPGRAKSIVLNYGLDPRYLGRKAFMHEGGIIGFDFILNQLGNSKEYPFDYDTFKNSRCKFYAAVTNCRTGTQEYIDRDKSEDIFTAVKASCSLPFMCKKVEIGNGKYLDGGISEKIPLSFLQTEHYDKVIMVLTRPLDHFAKPVSDRAKKLCKNVYRRYPNLVYDLINEDILQNNLRQKIKKLRDDGKVFVIVPEKNLPIGRIERNRENLEFGYKTGYADGRKHIKEVIEYLKQ